MPRYMFILKRTDEALTAETVSFEEMVQAMGRYNDELAAAGALVDAQGLAPLAEGLVVDFGGEAPVVTDGPFAETHELLDGYWVVDLPSLDEARAWAVRIPVGRGSRVEVRPYGGVGEGPGDPEWDKAQDDWRERTGRD
jgi:hypothetical protein